MEQPKVDNNQLEKTLQDTSQKRTIVLRKCFSTSTCNRFSVRLYLDTTDCIGIWHIEDGLVIPTYTDDGKRYLLLWLCTNKSISIQNARGLTKHCAVMCMNLKDRCVLTEALLEHDPETLFAKIQVYDKVTNTVAYKQRITCSKNNMLFYNDKPLEYMMLLGASINPDYVHEPARKTYHKRRMITAGFPDDILGFASRFCNNLLEPTPPSICKFHTL